MLLAALLCSAVLRSIAQQAPRPDNPVPLNADWPQLLEALEFEPTGSEWDTCDGGCGDDDGWIYGCKPGAIWGPGLRGDPASEAEIEAAERRLGVTLPPSYRQFLRHSNGFSRFNHGHRVLPIQEVKWYSEVHPEWKDEAQAGDAPGDHPSVPDEQYFVYGESQDTGHWREEYLPHCLQISEEYDAGVLLLNPKVKDAEGEWEAWFAAVWLYGAVRYRSFLELVENEARTR